ncbi:hypothetical protein IKG45_02740 [Candidatus Saccharibacteria bacterium]|nr:hypothetical protein [Candidatus Saccharibacteria bacterium]
MKNKVLVLVSIVLASVFLLVGVSQTQKNAFATRDDGKGDADTALAKLYYNAMHQCIKEGEKLLNGQTIDTDDVKKGDIFNGIGESKKVGSLVEHHVTDAKKGTTDKYNDWINGAMVCEDDNSKLATSGVKVFNNLAQKNGQSLTMKDIVCSYDGSRQGDGIMGPSAIDLAMTIDPYHDCAKQFDNGKVDGIVDFKGHFSYVSDAADYFRKVIVNKVFGGEDKIPGGALSTYTDLEKYYLESKLFTSACASQSETDASSAVYTVKMYDESQGKWRDYYYLESETASASDKFSPYTDGGSLHNMTCKELANDINALAAREDIQKDNEEVITEGGQTDIEGIDHIDNENAFIRACKKKYSLGWLICPILNAMSRGADKLECAVDNLLGGTTCIKYGKDD